MTDHLFRASGPTQQHTYERGPRITGLETLVAHDIMPGLMLRVHTDAGTLDGEPVIGHGETYYVPTAAAAVIHDFMLRDCSGPMPSPSKATGDSCMNDAPRSEPRVPNSAL